MDMTNNFSTFLQIYLRHIRTTSLTTSSEPKLDAKKIAGKIQKFDNPQKMIKSVSKKTDLLQTANK